MSTGISWTDETWTIVTGCSKVSAGCKNCYAETLAKRLAGMGKDGYTALPWTKGNAEENVTLRPERLEQPLRWKRPRRVFVTSMGDLFHHLVPDEFIARTFAVMALSGHHTFQVLTKRPERMAAWVGDERTPGTVVEALAEFFAASPATINRTVEDNEMRGRPGFVYPWPLPNVWLGTSVEDQRAADGRIPHLLKTPAAARFLSCEPLIGPVGLRGLRAKNGALIDALAGDARTPDGVIYAAAPGSIHWVIAGGESGPNHRPMSEEWARSLRDQCVAAGVPFFFKQHSGHRNETGPELDGRLWRQVPEASPAVAS